ncbi:hypothetical protein HN840_01290 [archaeon]|jgi:hypothetical protein|nr:hypothetical protein [archaeon]MBT3731028.1 hypothetical protein [archaeon]MBT4669734.1 hypothetical protein [archaeon]MBT5029884.1 hypothetical protein [archaeon]MBT5288456.1 hypothetical protein [archaeon]
MSKIPRNITSFRIPRGQLEDRINLNVNSAKKKYRTIVPLRNIVEATEIVLMREELLKTLIRSVPIKDTDNKPYENSQIDLYRIQPRGLHVGQTFVYQGKINTILSNLGLRFRGYSNLGVSEMMPSVVFGRDNEGEKVLALYVPPIIEHHKEGPILLDGLHRCFLCETVGASTLAIHIINPSEDIPFDPIRWEKIQYVKDKPEQTKWYNNLKKELFRDLNYVAIDG